MSCKPLHSIIKKYCLNTRVMCIFTKIVVCFVHFFQICTEILSFCTIDQLLLLSSLVQSDWSCLHPPPPVVFHRQVVLARACWATYTALFLHCLWTAQWCCHSCNVIFDCTVHLWICKSIWQTLRGFISIVINMKYFLIKFLYPEL